MIFSLTEMIQNRLSAFWGIRKVLPSNPSDYKENGNPWILENGDIYDSHSVMSTRNDEEVSSKTNSTLSLSSLESCDESDSIVSIPGGDMDVIMNKSTTEQPNYEIKLGHIYLPYRVQPIKYAMYVYAPYFKCYSRFYYFTNSRYLHIE